MENSCVLSVASGIAERVVHSWQFVFKKMPSNVAKLKFYYLGGSSTFSPKDGCGCVNSKQTEIRPVSDDGIYEIFTLPHTEDDVLTKLTVTALDQNDNIVKEKVFENVPVTRNQVTRYTGSFFGSGGSGFVTWRRKSRNYSVSVKKERSFFVLLSTFRTFAASKRQNTHLWAAFLELFALATA